MYHSGSELQRLGQTILDKAVAITVDLAKQDGVKPTALIEATVREGVTMGWGDIPARLGSYGYSDPADSQGVVDTMWGVAAALDPTSTLGLKVTDVNGTLTVPVKKGQWSPAVSVSDRLADINNTYLAGWDGDACNAFKLHFTSTTSVRLPRSRAPWRSPWPSCCRPHQMIRQRANNDIWNAANKTLTVLDQMFTCSAADASTQLTVFSAVASVITASGPLGVALALVGLTSTFLGVYSSASTPTQPISGGSILAALNSLRTATDRVGIGVYGQEQDLVSILTELSHKLDGLDHPPDGSILIPEPIDVTKLGGVGAGSLNNPDPANPDGFAPAQQ